MKQRLSHVQIQRQVLAPIMQQSITILTLPLAELTETIEQEIQNNPLLEIVEDQKDTHTAQNESEEEIFKSLDQINSLADIQPFQPTSDDEEIPEKRFPVHASLEDYLLQQIAFEFLDPLKRKIGEFIVGNLDEDGYLKCSLEEIAAALGLENLALIEEVLSAV